MRATSIRRLGALTTDPERLRIALVNLLVNARHAVNGNGAPASPAASGVNGARGPMPAASDNEPAVTLKTAGAADSMRIIVADRGPG